MKLISFDPGIAYFEVSLIHSEVGLVHLKQVAP